MISTFLASLLPSLSPTPLPRPEPQETQETQEASDAPQRIAALAEDVPKLEALAQEFKDGGRDEDARAVFRRILELDAAHEAAHKGLRHHFYDGQWFESYAALSTYKREEQKRMAEKGLARFKDGWVPIADVPYLRMSWTKDGSGTWRSPSDLLRAEQEARYAAEGWKQQSDLVWVPANEASKWEEGLWKCGDQWLPTEGANAYHAELGRWWTSPQTHFVALCTLDWESARWAGWYADQVFADLVRLFGVQPAKRLEVAVVNSVAQYNALSGGDQAAGRPGVELTGFSSLHYAFFADNWLEPVGETLEFRGIGVAYWDRKDPANEPFGQFAIRHAAAHSFVEAIDPSWEAVSQAIANQQGMQAAAFWAEKRIPLWLRYGAASYVERYLEDRNAGDGGDPWGFRTWALDNVRNKGGLRPLSEVFAFALDLNNIEGSTKLINEAGLLVSFVLDGQCAPVQEAHAAFKTALQEGKPTADAVQALQQALVDNEAALRKYAGL